MAEGGIDPKVPGQPTTDSAGLTESPTATEASQRPIRLEVVRSIESNPEQNLQALVANLEQANQETQGSLLIKIPSTSGGDILFLKNPESTWEGSRDKARRTNYMGVGSGGLLIVSGPVAEEINARKRGFPRAGGEIIGETFEELLENGKGTVDETGQETKVRNITNEDTEGLGRWEKNLKGNLFTARSLSQGSQAVEHVLQMIDELRSSRPLTQTPTVTPAPDRLPIS